MHSADKDALQQKLQQNENKGHKYKGSLKAESKYITK